MRPHADRSTATTSAAACPGALLLAALALLGAGCKTSPRYPPEWSVGELSAPSERILWEVTVLALEKHDFPVGANIDPVALEATSGWRNSLAPFRGEGYRERAHVKYRHVGSGVYEVEVRVEHEVNMDLTRPLELQYAEWKEAPDDTEEAAVILQRIKAYLGGDFELSPEEELPWE